jgi:hypothetical protein
MAIKNKDGTTYEIKKPNPLMKNQDTWDSFQTYNLKNDISVVEKLAKKFLPDEKIIIGKTEKISNKNEKIEIIRVDAPPVPPPTEMPLPTLPPPEFPKIVKLIKSDDVEARDIQRPNKINEKLKSFPTNVMNCLLAKLEEKIDSLYEDKSLKVRYSKEVAFEAVILEENDYELNFWTHLDYITKKSVVYPMNRDRRWWKIEDVKKAPQGYFCSCKPSDLQPSFRKQP